MELITIPLLQLQAHPHNSNRMSAELFAKLKTHLQTSDRYPPLIVRRLAWTDQTPAQYQLLDGHHRAAALRELGRTEARCVIWEVDDAQALELLATLNRLQGRDDPLKRAELLEALRRQAGLDAATLAQRLPEDQAALEKWRTLLEPAPRPVAPPKLADMPVAVHFFLLPADRLRLEQALAQLDRHRETALMQLVQRVDTTPPSRNP